MKNLIAFLLLFNCYLIQSQEKLLKTYSFSEVEKLQKENPKPLVVFIYTNWCKVCFAMKKNTFQNKNVVELLNKKYYFIKLNAEEKQNINFLNKTFVYKPYGNNTGYHELALELGNIKGSISYPTTVILNTNYQIEMQNNSYINHKTLLLVLKNYLQ